MNSQPQQRGILRLARRLALGAGLVLWVTAARAAPPAITLELVAEGFQAPLLLTAPNDGTDRRYVVDQVGLVHEISLNGVVMPEPFLDLRERMVPLRKGFDERGLLGLAFHPRFGETGKFYVTYSALRRPQSRYRGPTASTRRVSEFRVREGRAELGSERVLLEVDWANRKHNGGGLAFGPDGFLYIGLGDGGGIHGFPEARDDVVFSAPPDRFHYDRYAQDTGLLYGKILRIDVDRGEPYAIPPGNPFRGDPAGRDEIYAWGFRNPFRLTFDREGKGEFYVAGVAETFWEAIYRVSGPGNYGWAIKEASHCFDRSRALDPPADCPDKGPLGYPIHDPVVEYLNLNVLRPNSKVRGEPVGTAVLGGYVYRGRAIPGLRGYLVFGDFSATWQKPSGQVFAAGPVKAGEPAAGSGLWPLHKLATLKERVHSLGEDAEGELYVLTTARGVPIGKTGKVYRIAPAR